MMLVGAVTVALLLGSFTGIFAQGTVKKDRIPSKTTMIVNIMLTTINPWAWPPVLDKENINIDKSQYMPNPRCCDKYKPLKRVCKKPRRMEM